MARKDKLERVGLGRPGIHDAFFAATASQIREILSTRRRKPFDFITGFELNLSRPQTSKRKLKYG